MPIIFRDISTLNMSRGRHRPFQYQNKQYTHIVASVHSKVFALYEEFLHRGFFSCQNYRELFETLHKTLAQLFVLK
jgi:hypothetical protein